MFLQCVLAHHLDDYPLKESYMKYFKTVTDLETGKLRKISIGEHLTVSEAAIHFGVTRDSLMKVLLHLRICHKEWDKVAGQHRHLMCDEAVKKGLGFRALGEHGPYVVLSPSAISLLKDDLPAFLMAATRHKPTQKALMELEQQDKQLREPLDVEGKVRWLIDHHPNLSIRKAAGGIGVSESYFSRMMKKQRDQRSYLEQRLKEDCSAASEMVLVHEKQEDVQIAA